MPSELANLILDVEDLDRSLGFYADLLEVEVARREDVDGNRIAYLMTGWTTLMLVEQPVQDRNPDLDRQGGLVVKFYVSDLSNLSLRLNTSGVEVLQRLDAPECGEKTLLVRDPDGYAILLAEPLSA